MNKLPCVHVNANDDAEIPHDEGNPETPDYQFVKWMTRNKVLRLFACGNLGLKSVHL